MIEIYPNKLEGRPIETHTTNRRMTICEWLNKTMDGGFSEGDRLPVSVWLNEELIEKEDWVKRSFKPKDCVKIILEPRGIDEVFVHMSIFKAAFKAVMKLFTPALPGSSNYNSNTSGNGLNEASAKANKVKFGDVIRESFGLQRIYPDYLLSPRRYFASPRDQRVDMCLCVGRGSYVIENGKVLVGETPLVALGADAAYTLYEPGADLSADPRAEWWYAVPEVGSSSNGSAGLELTVGVPLTGGYLAASQIFSGYTISIPTGSGEFPSDWNPGLVLRVLVPYTYEFLEGGAGADIIRGTALQMLNPTVGDLIEIAGANQGNYVVASWDGTGVPQMTLSFEDGTPVTAFTLGTLATSIGPRGQRFRIVSFSTSVMTLERLDSDGAIDPDWPGFDFLQTANASVTLDPSNLEGGYRGPFAMCPEGELADALEFSVFCPQGLIGLGREGQEYYVSTFYQFEYRDMASSGDWTVLPYQDAGATFDSVGFTKRITLPYAMRPEARIKKLFVQQVERESEVQNDTSWYSASSRIVGAPTSYPGVTVMTCSIRGGDRLSAQSETQLSVEATRKLPIYSESGWSAEVPTRRLDPVIAYIAKSLGAQDSDIDLDELLRLGALWQSRADTFDAAYTSQTTGLEALNNVCNCGFSEITIDRGRLRPVRDQPRLVPEHMYSPQNYTEPLVRDSELPKADDYDGVDVKYFSKRTWSEETEECRLPGDLGLKIESIEAIGISDRNKAYQYGMRRRRVLKYRREAYTFSTEMDALNSEYLSYCYLSDDVPGYSQSALLAGIDSSDTGFILTSTEPLDFSTAGVHMVALRRPDGSVSGPYTAARYGSTGYQLQIDALDFTPETDWSIEPPHLQFGPAQTFVYPALVSTIEPEGVTHARVDAVGYDARVYLDDDSLSPDT